MVVVVGDVNSTLACALTAVKLGVPVAARRGGPAQLRPDHARGDQPAPHRRDQPTAVRHASRAGRRTCGARAWPTARIHFVGNVMIDTLLASRELSAAVARPRDAGRSPDGGYAVLTLHRPANVDDPASSAALLSAVERVQRELPLVFPVHPRTRAALAGRGGTACPPGLRLTEPLGYLDFMR